MMHTVTTPSQRDNMHSASLGEKKYTEQIAFSRAIDYQDRPYQASMGSSVPKDDQSSIEKRKEQLTEKSIKLSDNQVAFIDV